MKKQIKIRIFLDGSMQSETVGIKGKTCINKMKEVEQLTNAKIIHSELTHEYYENETSNLSINKDSSYYGN